MGSSRVTLGEIGKAIVVADDGVWLRRITVMVFCSGALLTWLIAFLIYRAESRDFRHDLETQAINIQQLLVEDFARPVEVVHAIGSYFSSSNVVTHDEFVTFSSSALARHPSLAGLEWAPVIKGADRPAVEQRVRESERLEGFRIRALDSSGQLVISPEKPLYVPLMYLEPAVPEILGMDLFSEPSRRATLQEAAASDHPFVSERFRLVEDPHGEYSVALYLGIPDQPRTVEETRGFAIVLFRLSRIAEGMEARLPKELAFRLVDGDTEEGVLIQTTAFDGARESLVKEFPYAGRKWRLEVQKTQRDFHILSLITIIMGLVTSIFSCALVYGFGRARRLEKEVEAVRELGQYQILEKLGQGGMGLVYRAHHALLQRDTAVKVISTQDPVSLQRFEREVRLTAQLTHPNTISVFDYGRTQSGQFYYAMELVEGLNFLELVERFGPITEARLVHLLLQVLGSLREAHGLGVIHRDIKPENIMLTHIGGLFDFVKVLDFGLAKPSNTETNVTGVREVVGTPLFMAPEAIQGHALDGRSDMYSVGCVAYFLLTGRNIFEARTQVEMFRKHLVDEPPTFAVTHPDLKANLERCLSKDVELRPTAREFLKVLEKISTELIWTQTDAETWWSSHFDVEEMSPVERHPADSEA